MRHGCGMRIMCGVFGVCALSVPAAARVGCKGQQVSDRPTNNPCAAWWLASAACRLLAPATRTCATSVTCRMRASVYGGERLGGWVCTRVTPCLCCTHRTRRHGVTRVHTEHTIACLHSSTRDRACEEARARTDSSGCMLAYMTIRM